MGSDPDTSHEGKNSSIVGEELSIFLKSKGGKVLVFSKEKTSYVDKHIIRRNNRYLASNPDDADPSISYLPWSKYPAKAMCLGIICSYGWIEGSLAQWVKTGAQYKE